MIYIFTYILTLRTIYIYIYIYTSIEKCKACVMSVNTFYTARYLDHHKTNY